MMDCLAPRGQLGRLERYASCETDSAIAAIAFHSLEDRWIKRYFRDAVAMDDDDMEERWPHKVLLSR